MWKILITCTIYRICRKQNDKKTLLSTKTLYSLWNFWAILLLTKMKFNFEKIFLSKIRLTFLIWDERFLCNLVSLHLNLIIILFVYTTTTYTIKILHGKCQRKRPCSWVLVLKLSFISRCDYYELLSLNIFHIKLVNGL